VDWAAWLGAQPDNSGAGFIARGVAAFGEWIDDANVLAVGVVPSPYMIVGDGGSYSDAAFLAGNPTPGYEFEKMDNDGFRSSSRLAFCCNFKEGRGPLEGPLAIASPCDWISSRCLMSFRASCTEIISNSALALRNSFWNSDSSTAKSPLVFLDKRRDKFTVGGGES
jgi:hypothetical protein